MSDYNIYFFLTRIRHNKQLVLKALIVLGIFASTAYAPRVLAETLFYSHYNTGSLSGDFGTSLAPNRGGMRWIAPSTGTIDTFKIPVSWSGSGDYDATITLKVFEWSSDTAFGALIGQSDPKAITSISTTQATTTWVTSDISVTSGSKYYVVLESSEPVSTFFLYHSGTGASANNTYIYAREDVGPWTVTTTGVSGHSMDLEIYSEASDFIFNSTRIIAFVPPDGSITSTTTIDVGFDGYLDIEDWDGDPAYFTYNFHAYCGNRDCFQYVREGDVEGDLTTFGAFSYSTSTSGLSITPNSIVTQSACIYYNPITVLGFSFNYSAVCDNATFSYGTTSTSIADSWIDEFQSQFASTTAQISTICNPIGGSFSFGNCLYSMFLPPGDILVSEYQTLRQIPPWGYGFRFYDILSGNATTSTSSLPVLSYTSPSNSIFGVSTFSFDPFGTLLQAGSIVNATSTSSNPQTVWDILQPITYIIVYFSLLLMILHDLRVVRHNKN